MSHTIVTLQYEQFYIRTVMGTPLLNIGGETYEVDIEVSNNRQYAFKAYKKGTKEFLCSFCCWHMHGGPDMYQIEGASMKGECDATLLVFPTLADWQKESDEPEE